MCVGGDYNYNGSVSRFRSSLLGGGSLLRVDRPAATTAPDERGIGGHGPGIACAGRGRCLVARVARGGGGEDGLGRAGGETI